MFEVFAMSLIINEDCSFLTNDQKILIKKVYEKLISYKNYWACKSHLITIANRNLFTEFQIHVTFAFNLKFYNLFLVN